MVTMLNSGAYVLNGTEIIADDKDAAAVLGSKLGSVPAKEEAKKGTIAYGILKDHNVSGNMEKLQIKFDKLTSHDITFVGIIQTARASGMEKFPVPYVLLANATSPYTGEASLRHQTFTSSKTAADSPHRRW